MSSILENPTFVLFAILFAGLALGNITVKGVSLGASGVLFTALLAGHLKLQVPQGISEIGTAFFVYAVGLGVGNRFFSSLRSRGRNLILVALVIVFSGWICAWGACLLLGIDLSVGAGLYAGACTSTPALAAALDAAKLKGLDESVINIGYGVAYPVGVVGIVLFVQLLPRLLKQEVGGGKGASAASGADDSDIKARLVVVTNPSVYGKTPHEVELVHRMSCRITRKMRGGQLLPLQAADVLKEGDEVLMVGEMEKLQHDAALLGQLLDTDSRIRLLHDESADLIVLAEHMDNKSLAQLDTLGNFGITVSRVSRLGNTFVPTEDTQIQRNDVVHVVGTPDAIAAFTKECGHRETALNMVDMLSLTGGLVLGILLGKLTFSFGGGDGFSLGMAGGPLVVALIMGHFGKVGPIAGYMPRSARVLVMNLGLMLFLAGAGVKGGEQLVETLAAHGVSMVLVGVMVTTIPLVLGYVFASKVMRMEMTEILGCCCGAQTSTPALGAITAKTDSQEPVIAYSTAYPVALILMTVLAQLLVQLA